MKLSTVVKDPAAGARAEARRAAYEGNGAPLGATVALTIVLALACFTVVLAVVALLVEPQPVPGFDDYTERQGAESGLYVAAVGIVLIAVLLVPRLADAGTRAGNREGLSFVAGVLAGTFATVILVARALPGGVEGPLTAVTVWWVLAAGPLLRLCGGPWPLLERTARFSPLAWTAAALLLLGALVAFTSTRSMDPFVLAVGGVATGGAMLAAVRRTTLPHLSRKWGAAADLLVIVLLLLVVPDLGFLQAEAAAAGDQAAAFQRPVVQFHQNFYLGPVNEVLHGGAVLVDTASQYGVGSIYLLAAWFQLVPLSYGMLGLLDGLLFALLFAAGYSLLRIAGAGRVLALAALAVTLIALIYNLVYPVGSLLQHGPLRFGLPLLVVLAAAAGSRWPVRRRAALVAQAVIVGLSSIWAFEAFAFTFGTFLAIAGFEAWIAPREGRSAWRRLGRSVATSVVACIGFQGLLVVATLLATGQLPEWGQYLAFLRGFLLGELGELTYDFSRWSAGLPLGAAYLGSAAALFLLVRRRQAVRVERPTALLALAGVTAYGVILFSYFVNRSADHILPYVAFPAVLAAALWLTLLLRGGLAASRATQAGALGLTVAVAVLLIAVAWSSVGDRFARTPLAHAAPGGESLGSALDRLADPAPIDPRASRGEQLVSRFMPGQNSVPVLVPPDLETEILIRSGRTSAFELGYAREDSFVTEERLPQVKRAVSRLSDGDTLLLDASGLQSFAAFRADPSLEPGQDDVVIESLAELQEWALREIASRFDFRVEHRDELGFVVARLVSDPLPEETTDAP